MGKKAIHGDTLDLDTESTVEDSDGQSLWIRVGPVYSKKGMDEIPGIWVSYQPKHLESKLQGPVLISPESWEKLKHHIDMELQLFNPEAYKAEEKK